MGGVAQWVACLTRKLSALIPTPSKAPIVFLRNKPYPHW